MKKIYIFALSALALLGGCSDPAESPEFYQDDITDAVKYFIAEADYLIDLAGNPLFQLGALLGSGTLEDAIDRMEEEFADLYTDSDLTYREVLERVSHDDESEYQEDARGILQIYDGLVPSLTDYRQVSSRNDYKSWTFKELHTGIEFLFELEDLDTDYPIWYCSPVEKSYYEYISDWMY